MPIPAGAFNRPVEVWRNVLAAANGLGEKLRTPQKDHTLWASVDAQAATERAGIARTEATTTKVFTVRFAPETLGIDTAVYFIKYQGRIYNIRSATEVGFREGIDIVADARADTAATG